MIHNLLSDMDLQNHPVTQTVILLMRKLRLTFITLLMNDLGDVKSRSPEGQC